MNIVTPQELSQTFCVPGLQFFQGAGDLVQAVIKTPGCEGSICLQGAHVTGWKPTGAEAVLWMSDHSMFERGKPIRGGVPICFPWFGPHPVDSHQPAHGTARILPWEMTSAEQTDEQGLVLFLRVTIAPFQLVYRVEFGSRLQLSLTATLAAQASAPERFEMALHSYFSVTDIRSIQISGLEDSAYVDKMDSAKEKPATGCAIQFEEETDRVYQNTTAACRLVDPGAGRTIVIEKTGSDSTVIWNPWIAKSQRMPDFGNNEWTRMVCVETANIGPHAVILKPGESQTITASIMMEPKA